MGIGIANLGGGFLGLVLAFGIGISSKYNITLKNQIGKYKKIEQARFGCKIFIISSAILIISGLLYTFVSISIYVIFISWILYLFVLIGGIIYMYTGEQFKNRI